MAAVFVSATKENKVLKTGTTERPGPGLER